MGNFRVLQAWADEIAVKVEDIDTSYPQFIARFYINDDIDASYAMSGGSFKNHYYENLQPDTRYKLTVKVVDYVDESYIEYQKTIYQYTDGAGNLEPPTLDTGRTVKTNTSIEVFVNPQAGVDRLDYELWNNAKTQLLQSVYNSRYADEEFTGLTPATPYQIRIRAIGRQGWGDSDWSGWYVATTTGSVNDWEWWSDTRSGKPFKISRNEWLAFQNKINETRQVNGLGNYSFTTSTTYINSGKPFSAWLVNEAINAINPMMSGSMATVMAGQTISSNFFNGIKNNLNSCI